MFKFLLNYEPIISFIQYTPAAAMKEISNWWPNMKTEYKRVFGMCYPR